jgi:hypothetical protein
MASPPRGHTVILLRILSKIEKTFRLNILKIGTIYCKKVIINKEIL